MPSLMCNMHSPSPSPAPLLAQSASLSRHTSANELPDHVAHHGSTAAWPLIFEGIYILPITDQCTPPARGISGEHQARPILLTETNNRITCQQSRADILGFLDANPHHDVKVVPLSDPITHDSLQNLRQEDLGNTNEHVNSDVRQSDNPGAPDANHYCSQSMLPDGFSMNDPAHQFPAGQNIWAEETLPQSSINTPLNIPEASSYPAIALPNHKIWPPQQLPAIPTPQNFTGFYNPSPIPYPNTMSHPVPSLMPPPLLTPARTPCHLCTESFARPSDLNRHWQSVHLGIKYHCDYWLGCPNNGGKGYCRLEKLRTHQREKHGFAWS